MYFLNRESRSSRVGSRGSVLGGKMWGGGCLWSILHLPLPYIRIKNWKPFVPLPPALNWSGFCFYKAFFCVIPFSWMQNLCETCELFYEVLYSRLDCLFFYLFPTITNTMLACLSFSNSPIGWQHAGFWEWAICAIWLRLPWRQSLWRRRA